MSLNLCDYNCGRSATHSHQGIQFCDTCEVGCPNYDPTTGIAVMDACFPNCRIPCVPRCPVDGHRTRAVYGPPGLAALDAGDGRPECTICAPHPNHGRHACRKNSEMCGCPGVVTTS